MTDTEYPKQGKCCLCSGQYECWGNNALPLKDGRCCDECNETKVIPARLARFHKELGVRP